MTQRICAICGKTYTPRAANQRYCTGARGKCYRAAMNAAYRSTTETAQCERCGADFERVRGRKQHRYCSDTCHHAAKGDRYRTAAAAFPPIAKAHDIARFKRSLRRDPCAYCGIQPANGIDHIEPTLGIGDRNDVTNMTACCKRCNETKSTLPLLVALPWIPLSRAYHDRRRELFADRRAA